jgi:phosphatidylinositol-4,5-bisphosphate 3-kinase
VSYLLRFKKLCEKAYMALRKRSHFLITLFMMMMNTGIPEISSLRDVEFLRKTLVPHYNDNDARNHWTRQSSEALKNSFWAAVNFAFHNAARDNRQ